MHQSRVCSVVVCNKARDWQPYPTRYRSKHGLARRTSANKVAALTTSDISCSRLLKTTDRLQHHQRIVAQTCCISRCKNHRLCNTWFCAELIGGGGVILPPTADVPASVSAVAIGSAVGQIRPLARFLLLWFRRVCII